MNSFSGYAGTRNTIIVTTGTTGTLIGATGAFPCQLSVFDHGTLTLSTILTTSGGTLANPFLTGIDGSYAFTAASASYDLVFSASGSTVVSSASEIITVALGSPLSVDKGGTGFTSYTAGDLIAATGTTTLGKVAIAAAGSVLVSGASPAWSASPALGTSLAVGTSPALTGDVRMRSGFTLNANNNAGLADGTVLSTDAVDKTGLGGSTISVANNGVISLGATMNGFLIVQTANYSAMLAPRGAVHAITIVSDPTGSFTTTAGSASLVNVYWSAGNSRYELQNKTGVTISAILVVLGVT